MLILWNLELEVTLEQVNNGKISLIVFELAAALNGL